VVGANCLTLVPTHFLRSLGRCKLRCSFRWEATAPRACGAGTGKRLTRSGPRGTGLCESPSKRPCRGVGKDAPVSTEPAIELERVYRQDRARMWRCLLGFTGDPELARDAMAEAFAQALGRGDAVRDLDRWVWRAAFRIASGEMKRRSRRRTLIDDRSYEMTEPPIDLLRILRQLSPKQRAVIILHFYAGHPTREIAAILGCTNGTVRVHISQGRKRLRRLLEEEDV
jgi:RNA polymerase sigma factor (sigma-70 family)